ncbi:hypothetical protein ACRALDRAFT_206196 [Sodiomyces alcalophilus JCM 7366]|uniref:uncharacterized protein n=1 Tax=Sodiomyces alcalophilus JCM 7366 TaxID=591952 RepID=UPI0039B4971B
MPVFLKHPYELDGIARRKINLVGSRHTVLRHRARDIRWMPAIANVGCRNLANFKVASETLNWEIRYVPTKIAGIWWRWGGWGEAAERYFTLVTNDAHIPLFLGVALKTSTGISKQLQFISFGPKYSLNGRPYIVSFVAALPNSVPIHPSAAMEDISMKEDVAHETNPSDIFIPPSVDQNATLAGDSYTYYSPIPSSLLPSASSSSPSRPDNAATVGSETTASPDSPPVFLGIDEAGRGPVLGPMVYSAFYVPVPLSDPLLRETYSFDDSKALTPATRTNLMRIACDPASDLATSCGFAIRALSARDIAAGMLSATSPYNLNAQAFDATIEIIRGVMARGVRIEEVFVDTVGQPAAHQARLQRALPGIKITVAKKADSLYPCVSAASVCAKVTRDSALELLYRSHRAALAERRGACDATGKGDKAEGDDEEGMAWGSGYPSDGRCVTWLKNNMHPVFGWGPECRLSWGTAKDMVEGKNGVKVDWPMEDDGETNRLTDYFVTSDREKDSDELGTWFGRPAGLEAF